MSSTFSGYSISYSGMSVNQTALSVTSHNISNVNTTGYSRQRVTAEETTINLPSSSVGSGVSVQEITRARNQLLDKTYRQQNDDLGYWSSKTTAVEDAEALLNEFTSTEDSDSGILQTIEDFFASWEELSKDPDSLSNRQSVLEYATSLIDTLSSVDGQLEELQLDAAAKVEDGVAELNDLAQQVAELNIKIKKAEASGLEANDLRDQRDTLLDSMSFLTSIAVSEQTDGTVSVSVGGVYLVQGGNTNTLSVSGDGSAENPLAIEWTDLGQEAKINGGSILAYLEEADQSGVESIDSTSIPYAYTSGSNNVISSLRQGLNDLIITIAAAVNEIHSAGTDLDGNTGTAFFVPVDDSEPLSITNIQVNPDLEEDTNKIVAAYGDNSGDNTAATEIAGLVDEEAFQFNGLDMDLSSFYSALISWIGTTGENANSYYETQYSLVAQIDNQRLSVSSVSLDEELSNMIMYQNAYSASARVLNTIDGLIADLIDELG